MNIENRLDELNKFCWGLYKRSWMRDEVFKKNPEFMEFPIEEVPQLIIKALKRSKLNVDIKEKDISICNFCLDRFSFTLPMKVVIGDTDGWGDYYTSNSRIQINVGYGYGKLDINASLNGSKLIILKESNFNVNNYETEISRYCIAFGNYLSKQRLK